MASSETIKRAPDYVGRGRAILTGPRANVPVDIGGIPVCDLVNIELPPNPVKRWPKAAGSTKDRYLSEFLLAYLNGRKPRVRMPCGRRVIDAEPA